MFESLNQIAERTATSVSRRQFLGRLGRGAAAAASVLGALLLLPRHSQGGRRGDPCVKCFYTCANGSSFVSYAAHNCPKKIDGCGLSGTDTCGR